MQKQSIKKESKDELKHFVSAQHHVEFDYPSKWNMSFDTDSNDPHSVIYLHEAIQDSNDTYAEEFVIIWEQYPMAINDSMNHAATIGQFKLTNNLQVENKGSKKFGQNTFYEFQTEFSPDEGKNKYQLKGFTKMNDSISYQIHFTTEKGNLDKYQNSIETILKSFKAI